MESQRFDAITKKLSRGASRRAVLSSLSAGAAGAVLGLMGITGAEAGKACTHNSECPRRQLCVTGRCNSRDSICTNGETLCKASGTNIYNCCDSSTETCSPDEPYGPSEGPTCCDNATQFPCGGRCCATSDFNACVNGACNNT
jgi:hypothetical protein